MPPSITLIIALSNPAGERSAPLAVAAVIHIIPLTNAAVTPHTCSTAQPSASRDPRASRSVELATRCAARGARRSARGL